jgi:predicted Ser/Thr protein kinase
MQVVAYTFVMDKQKPAIAATLVDPRRPLAAEAPQPEAIEIGARYEILRELGSGGMGRVFQVRDRETGEALALKVLRAEVAAQPSMAERFKNELRLARRITHKNVCRIYDFNRVGSVAYISMEYVDGETLRALLDRGGALPPARVVTLARQVCAGLAEAHAQGVIHRDLKPENIMITGTGAAKLMDFGIARSLQANTTSTQTLIGTPSYMAPEQVQGRAIDARSDIYALGLILYECLTGRRAFAGATPVEVALKQLQERPPAPHRLRSDVPRALEAAVMRCLEKDPAKRYASVDQLVKALAVKDGASISPAPRRRWPRAVAAVVLVLGGVIWKHRHEQAPQASASPPPGVVAPQAPLPRRTEVPPTEAPSDASPMVQQADAPSIPNGDRESARTAFQKLREAAEAGDADAQLRLAQALFKGPDAIRNESQARIWLTRAAEQGNADAAFALGMMYEHGRGGERDIRSAISWYERAAAAGHAGAQRSLAGLTERPIRRARVR